MIAEGLAETVEHDPAAARRCASCAAIPAAYAALGALASRQPSLAVMSVYLWAMVDRDPSRRPSAARTLLMLDSSSGADVRALWGEHGPIAARSTPRCSPPTTTPSANRPSTTSTARSRA